MKNLIVKSKSKFIFIVFCDKGTLSPDFHHQPVKEGLKNISDSGGCLKKILLNRRVLKAGGKITP
jgi:hypothetical protein